MKKTVVFMALCVVWSGIASAAVYFNNSQSDNSFTNDLNWNGPLGAAGGEAVNLVGADQAKIFAGETETRPIKVYLGNNVGTTGEMTVEGDLTIGQFLEIGYRGTGTFHMNSGSVQATTYDINVGTFDTASGTLNMSGGQMTSQRFFYVGEAGIGVMTMSGGTVAVTDYDVSVGQNITGVGTLNMYGGMITANRDFIVGEKGDGMLIMAGGIINAGDTFRVAEVAGSVGQFVFSGGRINAQDLVIGAGTASAGMIAFSGTAEMILDGNKVATIQGYIDNGYLTGAQVLYDAANSQTVIMPITVAGELNIDYLDTVAGGMHLSWADPEDEYLLQTVGALSPDAIWMTATNGITYSNYAYQVFAPFEGHQQFYRLARKDSPYVIDLAPDGAVSVYVPGMPVQRFMPEFTVLWSDYDPIAIHASSHPNYPVAPRTAVRWRVNNETLGSLNAWVGSDEFQALTALDGVVTGEGSSRVWEYYRDGILKVQVSGTYALDTSRPFQVAQNIVVTPVASSIQDGVIIWEYPEHEKFTFTAELKLPAGNGDPQMTFSITPTANGYVSVAFTGAPEVPLASLLRIPQRMEEKILRNYMMAECDLRLPRVHASTAEGNIALAVDQNECRFRLPSFDDSRFGLMLQLENEQVKPVLFAPILGGVESQMQAGHSWGFNFHWVVRSGDWKETYAHIAKERYNFRNRRDNSGPGSLNGTLERIMDFMADASGHNYAMWNPEQKYFDYFVDKAGVYKPFSPLYGLSAAIVTDDEDFFRGRALPNIEFALSRKLNLFAPFDLSDNGQVSSAERNLGEPYIPYSQLASLHEIFGRRTPALLALAETKGASTSSISDQLAVWRMTGDESALDAAKALAANLANPNLILSEDRFFDLLELAEATGDADDVALAKNAAYQQAANLSLFPTPPDQDMLVDIGGVVPVHAHSYGRHANVWGFPEPVPLPTEEKLVPAWRLSRIGIPGIGYPMEYWMNRHGALMSTAALTGDSFLSDIARSGMVGRFGNYPGDNRSNISLVPEMHDSVDRMPWQWNFATVNPGHAWDFVGAVIDFLVNDACERSSGNINFPAESAGGSHFRVHIYGGAPGHFYGDDNVNLWVPRGLVESDNPQFDWIAGYGNGQFYLALCNQSSQTESATLQLNTELVELNAGSQARVWQNSQESAPQTVSGNTLTVECPPRGLVAFAVPAQVTPRLQDKLNDPSSSALGPYSFSTVDAPFGAVHAALLRAGRDLTSAFVYSDVLPGEVIMARLRWRQGEGEWQEILDDIFPYEFSPELLDDAGAFFCVMEIENAEQQVLSSGVFALTMDGSVPDVTGISLPDEPFPELPPENTGEPPALIVSDNFVDYIKAAANGDSIGRGEDGRDYPYSNVQGMRIASRQRIWDKALYTDGCTPAEAEVRLRADLARAQLELTDFLSAQSVDFSGLSVRQQETLLDFAYTEGISGLPTDLVDAVLINDWDWMIDDCLYVRYVEHIPDSPRNVAFADRWNID